MNRLLSLMVVFLAAAIVLPAVPLPCPDLETGATLQTLINMNGVGNGCISQDKIFNNFSYDPLGGTVAASGVSVDLVLTQGGSDDIHGWLFAPISGGTWTTGFTLGYSIEVTGAAPTWLIVGSKDQINTGFVPNSVVATDVQSVGNLITRGLAGQETTQIAYNGVSSLTTFTTVVIPAGAGNTVLSYEQEWRQTAIPEPMTFVLIGTGLLGLGILGRRRAQK